MTDFPKNLYRSEQVQELDRLAIQKFNIPGMKLMERAGDAAYAVLRKRWPRAQRIGILCGVGNNGGDGYVIARHAAAAGIRVVIYQVGDQKKLKDDALIAFERLEGSHVDIHPFDAGHTLNLFDVVIDSMLGTGLKGEVKGVWRDAIDALNSVTKNIEQGRPHVLAIDIPSGLDGSTGAVLGTAVKADATISFIGMKQGLVTGAGPEYCGDLYYNPLQVPYQVFESTTPASHCIEPEKFEQWLQPRNKNAHKGQFGHVLVVGGNHGMSGAARMAAEAALRTGTGLVSVATREKHAHCLNQGRPEIMCHGVEDITSLKELLSKATVVVIGPGLGQDDWSKTMFSTILESQLPMVVDADALNLLAGETISKTNWVLTPHPGEAARLLNQTTADIQQDRYAMATSIQEKFSGVCVLKGAGTIVVAEDATEQQSPAVCRYGNPGMASAGMGDVLSGVIASLMAQGLEIEGAAELGVYLHAVAGDRAAMAGEKGLLASDLFPHFRDLINGR